MLQPLETQGDLGMTLSLSVDTRLLLLVAQIEE